MVVDVNRNEDTAQIASGGDDEGTPGPGDPVGRVNLPDEPEQEPEYVYGATGEAGPSAAPGDQLREKVLFGVMTIFLMILAMIVILQGVFEQKMPV